MGTGFEETRKIGLEFSEKMAGYLTEGETDGRKQLGQRCH